MGIDLFTILNRFRGQGWSSSESLSSSLTNVAQVRFKPSAVYRLRLLLFSPCCKVVFLYSPVFSVHISQHPQIPIRDKGPVWKLVKAMDVTSSLHIVIYLYIWTSRWLGKTCPKIYSTAKSLKVGWRNYVASICRTLLFIMAPAVIRTT